MSEQQDLFAEPNPFVNDSIGKEKLVFVEIKKPESKDEITQSLFPEIHPVKNPQILCRDFECHAKFYLQDITNLTVQISDYREFISLHNLDQEYLEWKERRKSYGKGKAIRKV